MPALATLAARVVAEEVALRRPMSVVITAAASPAEITPSLIAAPSAPSAPSDEHPAKPMPADERSFDVPIRLALAAGA
jgi:hypothetical protein